MSSFLFIKSQLNGHLNLFGVPLFMPLVVLCLTNSFAQYISVCPSGVFNLETLIRICDASCFFPNFPIPHSCITPQGVHPSCDTSLVVGALLVQHYYYITCLTYIYTYPKIIIMIYWAFCGMSIMCFNWMSI